MRYHPLLQTQVNKYLSDDVMGQDGVSRLIDAVNDAYDAFEKNRELSDRAFVTSQEGFIEINNQLKDEIEKRKLSVKMLKHTVRNLQTIDSALLEDENDDLLDIVDVLNAEISKRKEAEKLLIIAKEVAEKASKAKSEFLSVISHEIRTPLNAVLGMGHLLLKNQPREDQLDNLHILKTSADNLLVLINDILDFNKIEAGKLDLEEAHFDIRKLLSDLVAANTHGANERENKLALKIDGLIPDTLIGDSLRIGQILNNLISNAVKFTQKGFIAVQAELTGLAPGAATIRFSVHDTGVGIAYENLSTIFLPFTQASSSITRQFGGTGLGLAITKRLLNLLESDIEVASDLGIGSRFFFTLTLKISEIVCLDNEVTPSSEPDLQRKHILLVEDIDFNVAYAKQLLMSWNVEVDVAENGAVAVDMVQRGTYDLVLMDLQMPVMDGYTATERIREFNNKIPVIALTASATSNVREKVIEVGMQDYVTKPFNPDDFYRKLKKYLT